LLLSSAPAAQAPAQAPAKAPAQPPPQSPSFDEPSWSLFQKVFGMVLRDYVEPKTPQEVILGALQGAAQSAGPECAYVPPEDAEAYKALTQPGPTLPLYVIKFEDFARVLAVFPGQDPAIRPKDPLRFIGNTSTYDLSYPKVLQALRGNEGDKVKCLFLKQDEWKSYEVTLTRQMPTPPRFLPLGKEGSALVLPCLEASVPEAFAEAIAATKGPVIVDLRGCASPDEKAARHWAGELLGNAQGPSYKGAQGTQRLVLTGKGLLAGRPLRVLVDGTTARAGEVVALALSGAGAVLVGSPTFGNAPIVEDFPLENGGLLRLVTAYYLGPDGEMVKEKPLSPAIALTVPAEEKPEETYRRALKAPIEEKAKADKAKNGTAKAESEKAEKGTTVKQQPDKAKVPAKGDATKKK
jgi:C-terminal processing protease CtpA/Prc